jgi:hypothetical protein
MFATLGTKAALILTSVKYKPLKVKRQFDADVD